MRNANNNDSSNFDAGWLHLNKKRSGLNVNPWLRGNTKIAWSVSYVYKLPHKNMQTYTYQLNIDNVTVSFNKSNQFS